MMRLNLIDYQIGKMLHDKDIPFAALISAAMRKDSGELKVLYPALFEDLQKRYNSTGGIIPDDEILENEIDHVHERSREIATNYLNRRV